MLHSWWSGNLPDTRENYAEPLPSLGKGDTACPAWLFSVPAHAGLSFPKYPIESLAHATLSKSLFIQYFFIDFSLFSEIENLSQLGGQLFVRQRNFFIGCSIWIPLLCLWPLTCQLVPSCISNLSNEEKNTGTDGRRREGDCDREVDAQEREDDGEQPATENLEIWMQEYCTHSQTHLRKTNFSQHLRQWITF